MGNSMTIEQLLLMGLLPAVIGGLAGFLVARSNQKAEGLRLDRRIETDVKLAVEKLSADRQKAMSDKAWADYELRRDAYIDLARLIDCLFEGGDPNLKPEFHRAARRVRLVGSDTVVKALNSMTSGIKGRRTDVDTLYRALFNAMRRDIRRLHSAPPEDTELDEDSFPIES